MHAEHDADKAFAICRAGPRAVTQEWRRRRFKPALNEIVTETEVWEIGRAVPVVDAQRRPELLDDGRVVRQVTRHDHVTDAPCIVLHGLPPYSPVESRTIPPLTMWT